MPAMILCLGVRKFEELSIDLNKSYIGVRKWETNPCRRSGIKYVACIGLHATYIQLHWL